jgi:hypothetical protein
MVKSCNYTKQTKCYVPDNPLSVFRSDTALDLGFQRIGDRGREELGIRREPVHRLHIPHPALAGGSPSYGFGLDALRFGGPGLVA